MAKPRVFVSSTFYDLRQVRSDLELFIRDLGFDPVLNEHGNIPYGKDSSLEEYCYKEISNIDLFVSLIGGRFGSQSYHQNLSVSQMEFRTAIELHKQVYIFIDKNVSAEYQTYLLNKQSKDIKYRFADDVRIYSFIEFCERLPQNNAISSFETSQDITRYLKEQWAGLFQQLLRTPEDDTLDSMVKISENESRAIDLYCDRNGRDPKRAVSLIQQALWADHPAVRRVRQLFEIPYRFYFTSEMELGDWLATRRYRRTHFLLNVEEIIFCRVNRRQMKKQLLVVKTDLFTTEGELKMCSPTEWKEDSIQYLEEPLTEEVPQDFPF